jgi:hypothetical protein
MQYIISFGYLSGRGGDAGSWGRFQDRHGQNWNHQLKKKQILKQFRVRLQCCTANGFWLLKHLASLGVPRKAKMAFNLFRLLRRNYVVSDHRSITEMTAKIMYCTLYRYNKYDKDDKQTQHLGILCTVLYWHCTVYSTNITQYFDLPVQKSIWPSIQCSMNSMALNMTIYQCKNQ